jgi:amidase
MTPVSFDQIGEESEMQRATKDILYFEIGPDNEPTLRVSPGEEFEVETQLNPGPWLDDHPEREMLRQKLRGGNPSSGCIYIEGAMPGQVLSINIGEIDLDPVGFTNYWGSTGAMPGWMGPSGVGEHKKVVHIREGKVIWSEMLELPVAPMLGVIGVAPASTRWSNAPEVRIIERQS